MRKGKYVMDERSKRKLEETSIGVLVLFYIVCPIEMLVKVLVTHEALSILGELAILFSIMFTFNIVQRLNRNYSPTLPRKDNGEELSPEKTREARLKRLAIYAK